MERLVGDIVDRCLNTWLLGTYSAQFNALSVAATAIDTELSCQLPPGEVGFGSFIALEDELCYVAERDATNNRFVVVRGVRGTTAAPHAIGTPVEVNPRFPRFMVRTAMVEEIDGWGEKLYQPKTFSSSLASSAGTIDIPGTVDGLNVRGVIRVRRAGLSFVDDRFRRTNGYDVQGDFEGAGGTIMLADTIADITTFNVTVACDFDTERIDLFGDEADLLSDVGLTKGMCEILELGAAYRLLVGRGSVRLFPEAQGQSRVAQEVGSQDIPAFARSLLALRERAEKGEVERLYARYGFGGE